jgi:hypothetical protein
VAWVCWVGRTLVASSGGVLAKRLGCVTFFLLTPVAALPAPALLVLIWRRGAALPDRQSPLPASYANSCACGRNVGVALMNLNGEVAKIELFA